MPNLNEFLEPKLEKVANAELEKVEGIKPCAKCEENVSESWWNPMTHVLTWTCENGHDNTHSFN